MKSVELYRHLRAGLGEWFRGQGFKKAPRVQLGWHDGTVFVWFQCDQWGWDQYAGSSFFVNFQVGASPEPWSGPTERLQRFLTDLELEELRRLQNEVIRRLRLPPREYIEAFKAATVKSSDPGLMLDGLLLQFRPIEQPYRQQQDVSLRYFDPADVQHWASFMLGVLPRIVGDLRGQASGA